MSETGARDMTRAQFAAALRRYDITTTATDYREGYYLGPNGGVVVSVVPKVHNPRRWLLAQILKLTVNDRSTT